MAIEHTDRMGLPIYTSGTDLHPTREDFNDRMALLEEAVAIARQGTAADRPMPSTRGTLFMETDTGLLWFDTGDEWIRVVRIGNDGPGRALNIGGSGAEGSSQWAARADHTHPLPLATASQDGALSADDKALLNTASANATSNALARRNGSGQMSTAAPSAASHATNRGYVDSQISTRAPTAHTHNADDVDRGTLAPARLPAATTSQQGALGASDKKKLDDASPAVTPGGLMARNSDGFTAVPDPTGGSYIANRRYVDQQVGNHRHSASDVTSGTFSAARLPAATRSSLGAMSAAHYQMLDDATSNSTASTVAMRDSSGRLATADPSAATHAANRRYVDGLVADEAWFRGFVDDVHVDQITDDGTYGIHVGSRFSTGNGYPINGTHGSLTVYQGTSTSRGQDLIDHTTGRRFYRTRSHSGTWSQWREYGQTPELITEDTLFDSLESGYTLNNVVGVRTDLGNGLARVEASFMIAGVTVEAGGQVTELGTVAAPYRPAGTTIPVLGHGAGPDAVTMGLRPDGHFGVRWISSRSANWHLYFTFNHLVESE